MAYWLIMFGLLVLCERGIAETYENHSLLQLIPTNEAQFNTVRGFDNTEGKLEILKRSHGLNDSLDVLVSPEKLYDIQKYAKMHNLVMTVKDENYARKLQFEQGPTRRRFYNFQYNSFTQINNELDALARSSKLLQLEFVGKSFQGRPIKLVKISSNATANNPIIFIDAGIHGREWVAPAMAMYIINRLTMDPTARRDLDGVDWYILPVVNPDGYEYTRSAPKNRMWRKTMSTLNALCFGVDANRNFGFKWGSCGVSTNPCDRETYPGPRPFSEPETQIVKKIMFINANRMKLYISLHSYGQYIAYPWGYTSDKVPKSWKKLDNLAKIVSAAVVQAGGPPFKVSSAGSWYSAAGGSDDFAFGVIGIPYCYTMELTQGHEFMYPQVLLPSILPKFYQGFRAFKNEIHKEFGHSRHKREAEKVLFKPIENNTLYDAELLNNIPLHL